MIRSDRGGKPENRIMVASEPTAFSLDYLDHPATSRPKAPGVVAAMVRALTEVCASPERSNHRFSIEADKIVAGTRRKVSEFFGIAHQDQVIFTPGATWAINLALKGVIKPGDHVIASCWEHNAVLRPLAKLRDQGCEFSIIRATAPADLPEALIREFRPNTRLVALTHASNICGSVLPITDLARCAHDRGALVLLDAAQTVGHIQLNLADTPVDLVAFGAHKGLLGPPGVGCLLVLNQDLEIHPLIEGGTGQNSMSLSPIPLRPNGLEVGTANLPAIAGLGAALDFLHTGKHLLSSRTAQEMRTNCIAALRQLPFVTLYYHEDTPATPILLFNIVGIRPSTVTRILDEQFGIQARAGLHCAPLAHHAFGTEKTGAVRIGFGYGNDPNCVRRLYNALSQLGERRHGRT